MIKRNGARVSAEASGRGGMKCAERKRAVIRERTETYAQTLRSFDGNRRLAAQSLGIPLRTFSRHVRQLGLV